MSRADVCLLLEGTYPFVRGGVSSWVHQIISGLPELTFSLVFIGSRRADYGEQKYTLPENVAHLETHYLEDAYAGLEPRPRHVSQRRLEPTVAVHEWFTSRSARCARQIAPEGAAAAAEERRLGQAVDSVLTTLETRDGLSASEFLFGSGSWELIRELYLEGGAGVPPQIGGLGPTLGHRHVDDARVPVMKRGDGR